MMTLRKYAFGVLATLAVCFFVQPLIAQAAGIPRVTLTATPDTIFVGDSTTLSWVGINGVVACSAPTSTGNFVINGDPIGNIVVSPIVTTTYEILCTTSVVQVDAVVVVTVVPPPPPTVTLSASAASIVQGSSVKLTWISNSVVTGCTATSTDGLFLGAKGKNSSVTIVPPATATYDITCQDKFGATASSSVVVNVTPPPPIPPTVTLTAVPGAITLGDTSKLTWKTNAVVTSCIISSSDFSISGARPVNGNETVSPLSDTTYEIICEDAVGTSVNASAIVTVSPPIIVPDPPQVTLTANSLSILVGGSSDLLWKTNAVVVSCLASSTDGSFSGVKAANGTENVSPVVTATFTITCRNANGETDTASLIINVNNPPQPGPTVTLQANPLTILSGDPTDIRWITNAVVVGCLAGSTDGSFVGVKGPNGIETVNPVSTTTFDITCEDAGGKTASASVIVNISLVPPPPPGCNSDGWVDPGEQCDEGGNNGACPETCSISCTLNNCGGPPPVPGCNSDGWVDPGEQCDEGGNNGACPETCSATCTRNVCNGGGVPNQPSANVQIKNPLAFGTVEALLDSLLGALQAIVAILSLIMIVIGSIVYMTAAGDEGKLGTGKTIITAAIVGLALAVAAPSFLKEIGTVLGWGPVAPGPAAAAKTIVEIITNVLNFLLSIIGIIGVIMLVIGGLMYLTAAGDQKKIETGKKIVIYSIIGITVAAAALVLVTQVVNFFV